MHEHERERESEHETNMLANRLSEAVNDPAVITRIWLLSITHCAHKCYQLFGHGHLKHKNIQPLIYANVNRVTNQ